MPTVHHFNIPKKEERWGQKMQDSMKFKGTEMGKNIFKYVMLLEIKGGDRGLPVLPTFVQIWKLL